MRHVTLALIAVAIPALLALAPLSALAAPPIKVQFTAHGAPNDPVLNGLSASGYFIFDSSIIPYGGGTVTSSYPPFLQITTVSFSWDGHTWTEADAISQILTFAPDGSLIGWNLQARVSPGYVVGSTLDFAFDVASSPSGSWTFSYSREGAPGVYAGSIDAWDASTLPIILSTCYMQGSGHFLLDSFGRVFEHVDNGCLPMGMVTVMGNMFDGPPPGHVVGITVSASGNVVFATMQDGDVWRLCRGNATGDLIGNILYAPGIAAVATSIPLAENAVSSPRPNPFNPMTRIPYTLASPGRVRIEIFDVTGRLVRALEDTTRPAGRHSAEWDGRTDTGESAASGTYFGRITFPDGSTAERKMTVLK